MNPKPSDFDELPPEFTAFASELRRAHADPELSQGFEEDLAMRLQSSWSWKSSFQNHSFMRIAAGLLLLCVTVVPVAAVVALLQAPPAGAPQIQVEFSEFAPIEDALPVAPQPIAPPEPMVSPQAQSSWDTEWEANLALQYRFQRASARWIARHPKPSDADLPWITALESGVMPDSLPSLDELHAIPNDGGLLEQAAKVWVWVLTGSQTQ